MVPDSRAKKRAKRPAGQKIFAKIQTKPSSDDAHEIVYFKRHAEDDINETISGRVFLDSCPIAVQAHIMRVLVAVAAAPPKRFAGGGYWEAMKSPMNGWHEVRVDGPRRRRYRLFCRIDYAATNYSKPLLVVIAGRSKPFQTELPDADYKAVKALGNEYFKRNPRSIA
jgi:hypothetical protein